MSTLHPKNFLIVENDPNDAFLIRRALSQVRCGYSFVCRNPSEARSYLRGAGMYGNRTLYPIPNIVITDLMMGDETGIQLAEWIRNQPPPLSELVIVILTGSATDLQFDAAMRVGAQRVYRKPGRLEDLQKLLASIAAEFCSTSSESAAPK